MVSGKFLSCVASVLFIGSFTVSGHAATLTVLGSSTAAYSGYGTNFATDTGAGSLTTDYASNGGGAGTHLDFAISGGPVDEISVYDRTTSGGANGAYVGGTTDFTTSFELIFSNNANFSNPIATDVFTKNTPVNPTGPASFLFAANF